MGSANRPRRDRGGAMSATSYYATKQRVGARTERIRTEIDRSSAYILDSGNVSSSYTSPSYSSTLGRQNSFREDSTRMGRTRARDSSIDCTTRIRHRSGSMDFSAPVMMRTRDHSVDYSSYSKPTYTANNRAPRPVTTNYDNDDDEHSPEYKKIMGQTDVTLTLSKYAKKDSDSLKVDGMIEEERRSKAYSKIIGQSSSQQLEKDAYRSTMCDLFADTKSFSAKTMQAINKECLYKEDKGPKNYGWRKDMESYEENLEVQEKHRRAVRDSTRATNDVKPRYKDINAKLRDYDRECRRDVDSEEPVRKVTVTISTPTLDRKSYSGSSATNGTTSYSNGTSSYSNGTSSYSNGISPYKSNREEEEETPVSAPKRGSWRKDIEAYEEKLTKNKPTPVINRNVEVKEEPKETPRVYSWQKSAAATSTTSSSSVSSAAKSTTTTNYSTKTDTVKVTAAPTKVEEPKANSSTSPTWKKPEPVKVEVPKPVETKPTPSWKKPEPPKVETKPVETPAVKKAEEVKETPKWKKPETKVEETKAAAAEKKEETKPETPKAAPKWKKPEPAAAKTEEAKPAEEAKPTPKWKKPGTSAAAPKKEEAKPVEEAKPAPKWKKPETAKKEEPKPVEEAKPAPKWKKAEPAKKEEPKPAEEAKPTPKWKKPETKKEEPKTEVKEEEPTPKWKKPATAKKE